MIIPASNVITPVETTAKTHTIFAVILRFFCTSELVPVTNRSHPPSAGVRRGQGLGTEATRLVLDYAFHVLELRNVLLETLEWNAAGLEAYSMAGGLVRWAAEGRPLSPEGGTVANH